MAQNGVKTVDLATDVQLDEVIGNKLGGTKRVPVDQFVQALLGAGPLKTAIDGLQASIPITFETTALMVASTTLVIGDVVQVSDGRNWKIVAAGTGTADGVTYIDLATLQAQRITSASGSSRVLTKGAAFTATPAENGSTIVGSAAFTLSLATAASLGNGWSVIVDAEVGAITIDPNLAELIDGATTLVVSQGETARVICDGTAFRSVFRAPTISQAGWTAGTSTVDGLISPKKLSDTVGAAGGAVGGTLIVSDAKALGTAGKTYSAAIWNRHDVTSEDYNTITGASVDIVNSNITLPAGAYRVSGCGPVVYRSNLTASRLRDTTHSITVAQGRNANSHSSFYTADTCNYLDVFTLTATSTLELHVKPQTAYLAPATSYQSEKYLELMFEKIG